MDSLVLELQRKAIDKDSDVAELVRMALVVARKLRVSNFQEWAEHELRGHRESRDVPWYRRLEAEVKVHNPYEGWQPVVFESPEMAKAAQSAHCRNPIGEVQDMVNRHKPGVFSTQQYDPEIAKLLMDGLGAPVAPVRVIATTQLVGVLDAVRNIVLEWSLRLEQEGILGEGMTFTSVERKKASEATAIQIGRIGSVQSIIGSIQAGQVQVGDYASILQELKERGISQVERNELETILDQFKTATEPEKKPWAARGLKWVTKHAETLGELAGILRGWFGTA